MIQFSLRQPHSFFINCFFLHKLHFFDAQAHVFGARVVHNWNCCGKVLFVPLVNVFVAIALVVVARFCRTLRPIFVCFFFLLQRVLSWQGFVRTFTV